MDIIFDAHTKLSYYIQVLLTPGGTLNTPVCQIGTIGFSYLEQAAEVLTAFGYSPRKPFSKVFADSAIDCAANAHLELLNNGTIRELDKVGDMLKWLVSVKPHPDKYAGVSKRLADEVTKYVTTNPPSEADCVCIAVNDSVFTTDSDIEMFVRQVSAMVILSGIATPGPKSEPVTPFHAGYDIKSGIIAIFLATGYSNPRLWDRHGPRSA